MSMHREGFVEVYDTRTGDKLPNPVPPHHVTHPVLGRHLSLTPRTKADQSGLSAGSVPSGAEQIPASGDTTTSKTPKEK